MNHNEVLNGDPEFHVSTCETPNYNPEYERLIKIEAAAANRADLLQVSEFSLIKNSNYAIIRNKVLRQIPTSQRCNKCYWFGMCRIFSGPKNK